MEQPPKGAPAKKRLVRRWLGWLAAAFVVFLVLMSSPGLQDFLIPGRRSPARRAETSAVGSLRSITTAAMAYRDTYNNGLPPSLAALGPPPAGIAPNCNAADLIDSHLASGRKSGYVIVYTPGPPVVKPGAGCTVPGAKSYAITARPLEFDRAGRRSFFTDESGLIRATTEDRPATKDDPPI